MTIIEGKKYKGSVLEQVQKVSEDYKIHEDFLLGYLNKRKELGEGDTVEFDKVALCMLFGR